MKVTEVLGDSLRVDIDFIASKMEDLPKNASVLFLGKDISEIGLFQDFEKLKNVEIDIKNENRYKIHYENRPDLKIFFTSEGKMSDEKYDFVLVFHPDDNFERFKKFTNKKIFLLSTKTIKWPHVPDVIQLGLPETFISF